MKPFLRKEKEMQIERDFTSGKVTLAFENGKRLALTKEETVEFDKRIREIQDERNT